MTRQQRGLNDGKGGIAHLNGVQYGRQVNAEENTSEKTPGKGRKEIKMTETSKITVQFTQKVSEQSYETADYSLLIERVVPVSMGDEGIAPPRIKKKQRPFSAARHYGLRSLGLKNKI